MVFVCDRRYIKGFPEEEQAEMQADIASKVEKLFAGKFLWAVKNCDQANFGFLENAIAFLINWLLLVDKSLIGATAKSKFE